MFSYTLDVMKKIAIVFLILMVQVIAPDMPHVDHDHDHEEHASHCVIHCDHQVTALSVTKVPELSSLIGTDALYEMKIDQMPSELFATKILHPPQVIFI